MPARREDIDHAAVGQDAEIAEAKDAQAQADHDKQLLDNIEAAKRPLDEAATQTSPESSNDPYAVLGMSDETLAGTDLTPAQEAVITLNSRGYDSRSYHFSHGGGFAKVETEAIRDAAAAGRETLAQISELIQSMSSYVADCDAYWISPTGTKFRESFANGMKSLSANLEDFSEYTRELVAYADRYEGVITEANAIAQGIEAAMWQDV